MRANSYQIQIESLNSSFNGNDYEEDEDDDDDDDYDYGVDDDDDYGNGRNDDDDNDGDDEVSFIQEFSHSLMLSSISVEVDTCRDNDDNSCSPYQNDMISRSGERLSWHHHYKILLLL